MGKKSRERCSKRKKRSLSLCRLLMTGVLSDELYYKMKDGTSGQII